MAAELGDQREKEKGKQKSSRKADPQLEHL